jgi:hypothetical protein
MALAHRFPPEEGWNVTVDIDAMERGVVGQHPPDKRAIAADCESWLRQQRVHIVAHQLYGRADLVAEKAGHGTFVVEVEGDSSRQREQAMYSALGQIVLSMTNASPDVRYSLAVPDADAWAVQLRKVPLRVRELLHLQLLLVSKGGVREI